MRVDSFASGDLLTRLGGSYWGAPTPASTRLELGADDQALAVPFAIGYRDSRAKSGEARHRKLSGVAEGLSRKSAIRPMASVEDVDVGERHEPEVVWANQLKPVPWVTRIFLARSSSSTNCWSSLIG